jgi:predicted lipoprotein with Yx(FWY)xxD motif
MHTTSRLGIILTVLLATILAACSGGGASSPSAASAPPVTSQAPASEEPASEEPASEAPASEAPASQAPAAGDALVTVVDSEHGQILADGEGRTLYLFTPDTAGDSTCYDDCATNWPPLLAEGEITVGAGLDAANFSTTERTDGGMQVKIGEWPLYYFANDAAAGDTNGQGVGDVWYVVSPTGEAIQ